MTENQKPILMDHPFRKSVSSAEKHKRLLEVAGLEDTLAILINADPDAIGSALALKRIFWRKVKKILIYHINVIKRADNLALIKLLRIDQYHIRNLDRAEITKWAIVDSQPHHNRQFGKQPFDVIIDHHPLGPESVGVFVDINEDYGATSTMMTEYLRAAKIKPSARLATALFYGIKTDTENFVRNSLPNDVNAFRYLYPFANINIIKKIESSELTKKTLDSFRMAMENLTFFRDTAHIYMGKVNDPDILVVIADFFLKMAEATWCIVSGIYGQKLIIILRNAGFRLDAGKTAEKMFGQWGSAGGHKSAARAEIPIQRLDLDPDRTAEIGEFVLRRIKGNRKRR
ncbi:MAG: DHH family phosphoesterase [Deltaproteobacteria bacterium]|nr:DHH family phosphoesterase [Deltaproteobacteria bacterium]